MTTKVKFIPFGFIQNAHGLKGEVLAVLDSGESLEPFPVTLYAGQNSEDDLQALEVANLRRTYKGLILQFEGYQQRSQAESLKGLTLYLNPKTFQSKHFYLFEVLDFLVQIQRDEKVKNIGYVSHFISHSHQDLLVVKPSEKNKSLGAIKHFIVKDQRQIEIPFVSSYIQSIDFKAKKMTLTLPEGFPGIDEYAV